MSAHLTRKFKTSNITRRSPKQSNLPNLLDPNFLGTSASTRRNILVARIKSFDDGSGSAVLPSGPITPQDSSQSHLSPSSHSWFYSCLSIVGRFILERAGRSQPTGWCNLHIAHQSGCRDADKKPLWDVWCLVFRSEIWSDASALASIISTWIHRQVPYNWRQGESLEFEAGLRRVAVVVLRYNLSILLDISPFLFPLIYICASSLYCWNPLYPIVVEM